MPDREICPDCGSEMPPGGPRGRCARCLGGAGDGVAPARPPCDGMPGETLAESGRGVLESIATTMGEVPRILLRDTAPGEEPSPVVRTSPEMAGGDGLPRLQVLGEIGRGGMGAVLKGRDPDLGRDLAVKVLLEQHAHKPDLVRRFIEEAQIAGQLQHPGVAPVYELGRFPDARPYFAMKLVKGRTLAEVLNERPGPGHDQLAHLSSWLQVCQTVAYAHARGVIHRDLKPSNVMLGAFGEVLVMDWGLAKVLPRGGAVDDQRAGKTGRDSMTVIATGREDGPAGDLSGVGSVLGTPSYMAPEQARGETDQLDERADVFAMGSILCEVLTGQPAFVGRTTGEVLAKAARGDLADARARLGACGADAELLDLAVACLAPERDDRPRDAGIVASRCREYLGSMERRMRAAELERAAEAARAEEATRRVAVERQRRRYQLGLAAAVLAMSVVGGLAYTYVLNQRAVRAAREAEVIRGASTLRDLALAAPDDVTRWEDARRGVTAAGRTLGDATCMSIKPLADLKREIETRLAAVARDREFLARLGIVRADQFVSDPAEAARGYTLAFSEAGLDVERASPEEVASALRSRPRPVVLAATAALDDWAAFERQARPTGEAWRRVVEVARRIDRDPFRDRMRSAMLERDPSSRAAALRALAAEPAAADLAGSPVVRLARALKDDGEEPAALELLRVAAAAHPDDAWVGYQLGRWLMATRPPALEEAARHLAAVQAARPEARLRLIQALALLGRRREAADILAGLMLARLRRPSAIASEIGTDVAAALGWVGPEQSRSILDRPRVRDLLASRPDARGFKGDALDRALRRHGVYERGIRRYREALRAGTLLEPDPGGSTALNPSSRMSYLLKLSILLRRVGRIDEAVAAYAEAWRTANINFDHAWKLPLVLAWEGAADEVEAEARAMVDPKPVHPVPFSPADNPGYYLLGQALDLRGDYAEALEAKRSYLELVSPSEIMARSSGRRINVSLPIHRSLDDAERRVALAERLPSLLKGDQRPGDNRDRLLLAGICFRMRRYAAAARFWTEALEAEPGLDEEPLDALPSKGGDVPMPPRVHAARAAALAAAGRGIDDPPPDAPARARLWALALRWLRAVRDRHAAALAADSLSGLGTAAWQLELLKADADLAPVRDRDALEGLPEAERKEWLDFWASVDRLLSGAIE